MNILVIGDEGNNAECRQKFGDGHSYLSLKDDGPRPDVVFDFMNHAEAGRFSNISGAQFPVFINTCKINLRQANQLYKIPFTEQFGFAGLPTFLNRQIMEVSLFHPDQNDRLASVCDRLGTVFQVVEDVVGLITPRVICMIINEAYYTVQDGTASRDDIDMAMKLGTAYPFGPFEWCRKIGVRNVRELLDAVHADTGNERYAACELLRQEAGN